MPTITFLPDQKTVTLPAGTELLEAARRAGAEIEASCGGRGTCGQCIVRIVSGDVVSDSLGVLSRTAVAAGYVLACRTKVTDSDLTVDVAEQKGRRGGKFTDAAADMALVAPALFPQKGNYDPLARKLAFRVPGPQPEDGLSDLDRLSRRIQQEYGNSPIRYSLEVIRQVAAALRAEDGLVTLTSIAGADDFEVIRIESGDTTATQYGIAVDIGTTTIAVQLVDLAAGEILETRHDYNGQIPCGLDVISRINYARRPERLAELRERVLKTIHDLLGQITAARGIAPRQIDNAVLAGNTTMIHLLLGLNPEYIRLEPYTPTVMAVPFLTAAEIGLAILPSARVSFAPGVGSYVGGDITAGLLCTDLATETEAISLFIDIGTNGELVVGNQEFLMTCACSAGPAFEGGGIGCGMRAAAGAIERVEVDPASGAAACWTIGNGKPKGICGSGMISLLANLYLTGWLDAAGKLNRNRASAAIRIEGRHASYILATAEESGTGAELAISELDIDNIIRAKAAIYSACALMLQHIGIDFGDLQGVYIGGGFGRHLDLEKAKVIGLIPDLPPDKFHYVGNSSLMGAYMALVSAPHRGRQLELARKMTYFDLSTEPNYMDQYTGALFIPHTDAARFPTVIVQAKG